MPDKPEDEFPKVFPFVFSGASEHPEEEPEKQTAHIVQSSRPAVKSNNNLSPLGASSSLISAISVISMGAALISGAWFAYSVLVLELKNDILPKVILVGVAYVIGWIFSAFGVRVLGNFWLPYVLRFYTWLVLSGIISLHVLIMFRLYRQEYELSNYIRYLFTFAAGMLALVGLHIILERHSLIPYGVFILLSSLVHFYLIVYHYLFTIDVLYEKFWGDLIFFFVTTMLSLLMLAHFGVLNRFRTLMDRTFTPIGNPFVPPE